MISKILQPQQVVRFGLVGIVATITHLVVAQFVLLSGLATVFQSTVVGFLVAFAVSLSGHHWFTFRHNNRFYQSLWKYAAVAIGGFLANILILAVLVSTAWVSRSIALSIAVLAVPILSYVASSLWAFPKN
ncbi:GtrA family protein [uncultured Roseobacter sp.]|uniref:GtrA family protein n=1 Tax=uncultured Roseobacter sp. TaxID=114847 RepID=UPI002621FCD6|nr:GtrA family protein [uncultured Roseobacter sp.]